MLRIRLCVAVVALGPLRRKCRLERRRHRPRGMLQQPHDSPRPRYVAATCVERGAEWAPHALDLVQAQLASRYHLHVVQRMCWAGMRGAPQGKGKHTLDKK